MLFLDVEETRDRLKTSPWIAEASVLKLYPGELQIGIKEREAFAVWQQDGKVSVIADDGTVLEPFFSPGMTRLPLVVGRGAQAQAKSFLLLLEQHSALREKVRAAILVGERRWNLRLKNGIDVQLPETGVEAALARLVELDRAEEPDQPRYRHDRSAHCRPRDGASFRRRRGGARRGAQGKEGGEEGA